MKNRIILFVEIAEIESSFVNFFREVHLEKINKIIIITLPVGIEKKAVSKYQWPGIKTLFIPFVNLKSASEVYGKRLIDFLNIEYGFRIQKNDVAILSGKNVYFFAATLKVNYKSYNLRTALYLTNNDIPNRNKIVKYFKQKVGEDLRRYRRLEEVVMLERIDLVIAQTEYVKLFYSQVYNIDQTKLLIFPASCVALGKVREKERRNPPNHFLRKSIVFYSDKMWNSNEIRNIFKIVKWCIENKITSHSHFVIAGPCQIDTCEISIEIAPYISFIGDTGDDHFSSFLSSVKMVICSPNNINKNSIYIDCLSRHIPVITSDSNFDFYGLELLGISHKDLNILKTKTLDKTEYYLFNHLQKALQAWNFKKIAKNKMRQALALTDEYLTPLINFLTWKK